MRFYLSFFCICIVFFLALSCKQAIEPEPSPHSEDLAPGAPTSVRVIEGKASLILEWEATGGADSYLVRYGIGTGAEVATNSVDSSMIDGTKAIIKDLDDGTSYTLTVSALNSVGEGPASAPITATTDFVTGDAVSGIEYFPDTPGLCSEFDFTAYGGQAAESGKKWLIFHSPPEDARIFYTFSSENGGMWETGRYYNWVPDFRFFPYRWIHCDYRQRGILDLLAIEDAPLPGGQYSHNGIQFFVSRLAEPNSYGRSNLLRISFDARSNGDNDYRGIGYYILQKNVGIFRMDFIHSAQGAFGAAGDGFEYQLRSQTTAVEKTISGRLLNANSQPIPESYVSLNCPGVTNLHKYIISPCATDGSFSITAHFPDNAPFTIYYGVDRGYDGNFDESFPLTKKPPYQWSGSTLDLGTVSYTPTAGGETPSITPLSMVSVPSGSFYRWGNTSDISTQASFLISEREITRDQFSSVMGFDPSDPYASKTLDSPVTYVNWYSTLVFCNKLSIAQSLTPVYSISGSSNPNNWGAIPSAVNPTWDAVSANWAANGYRLPTEMEWLWAAMGAPSETMAHNTIPFAGSNGSNLLADYAWTSENSDYQAHPSKTKLPNALGLYDMSGNVWEWCWDRYAGWPSGTLTDFRGPSYPDADNMHPLWGGSWMENYQRAALDWRRLRDPIDYKYKEAVGFRVVRR